MVEVKNSKVNYVKKHTTQISSRQKAPQVYDLNASIYIWKRSFFIKIKQIGIKKKQVYL